MNKLMKISTVLTASIALFSGITTVGQSATAHAAKTKTYQVAVSSSSRPLSYEQNGHLKGYEVEALRKIDQQLPDVKFKYHAVSQNAELVGLDSGKYDLAVNGFYKNPARTKKYAFGKENDGLSLVRIYYNKQQFKNKVTKIDNLAGKELAPVNANGGMYNLLTTWNKQNGNKINVKTTTGIPTQQLLTGVNTGKYDAMIDPSNLGEASIIKERHLSQVQTSKPVRVYPTYILFSKKNKPLAGEVDGALKTLKKNGTMKQLSQQAFGENVFKYQAKSN